MQTLSAEELNDYADEYGLDAALAQRDYVAVRIAHAIASDPAVGGVIAVNEMIAEKWRCLVQRSPKRPGDPYDLWFLWTDFAKRKPRTHDDVTDGAEVRRLVPQKVEIHDGWAVLVERLDQYKPVWAAAIGKTLPLGAPPFPEVRKAVLEAARAWTPWA